MAVAHQLLSAAYLPLKWGNDIFRMLNLGTGGSVRVLLSHDIPPEGRANFARQIKAIARTWTFIAPSEFEDLIQARRPVRGRHVLMTFDDGFHSNRWAAEAVLAPLKIKALFFIPTNFVDIINPAQQRHFIATRIFDGLIDPDEVPEHLRAMGWEDIRWLADAGHAIGSHTCSHVRLATISEQKDLLEHELASSKARLQQVIGRPVEHFAFPFGSIGSINAHSLGAARKHYQFIHSGIRGDNTAVTPAWALLRDSMQPGDSSLYIRSILEGSLDGYYRRRSRKIEKLGSENGK